MATLGHSETSSIYLALSLSLFRRHVFHYCNGKYFISMAAVMERKERRTRQKEVSRDEKASPAFERTTTAVAVPVVHLTLSICCLPPPLPLKFPAHPFRISTFQSPRSPHFPTLPHFSVSVGQSFDFDQQFSIKGPTFEFSKEEEEEEEEKKKSRLVVQVETLHPELPP